MRFKCEIDWDYNLTNLNELIYDEDKIIEKTLQYLISCLRMNFITFFASIENLSSHLNNIFCNFYQKEYIM